MSLRCSTDRGKFSFIGIGTLMKYFVLKAYKINSVLSLHAPMVFENFLARLVQNKKKIYKVSVCFFENTY
jgi:hypothetical protein